MQILSSPRLPLVAGLVGLVLLVPCAARTSQSGVNPATPAGTLTTPAQARSVTVPQGYGNLPLSFEANQGQADPAVAFTARGVGYALFLTKSAAILSLAKAPQASRPDATRQHRALADSSVVRMEFVHADPAASAAGAGRLPGIANYFIGSNPSQWHAGIPTYARVRYGGIYKGIDLVYYGNQRQLEYDFVVAPNADPRAIRMRFAGARGLSLTPAGDLQIHADGGSIAFRQPDVYQEAGGRRQPIRGRFALLAGHTVGFTLGAYDHSRTLIIDPVLAYSTFLSGTKADGANAIAVDAAGEAYVAGTAASSNFPITQGAYLTKNKTNTPKAFVTRLNAAGTGLIYSTYLGGSGGDSAASIVLDSAGDAYVAGSTASTDFPVTAGAWLSTLVNDELPHSNGCGFVTKLNPTGTALLYSTYFNAPVSGMAVDGSGNSYLVGSTYSSTFPVTPGAFLTTFNSSRGGPMGFVSKVNPTGTALLYSTYLGGSGPPNYWPEVGDYARAVAVDVAGNAYVTGFTYSLDFPVTPGAFQTTNNEGYNQTCTVFVTKLNPTGAALVYSTFLGGSGNEGDGYGESPNGIALDSNGDAYIGGVTWSPDFPTANAFQSQNYNYQVYFRGYQGEPVGSSGFVTRFNPTGTALIFSTYMGGISYEYGGDGVTSIAVDAAGNAYVAGYTDSVGQQANPAYGIPALPAFPITPGAFQPANATSYYNSGDPTNGFVSQISPAGALLYSTYLGGSASDAVGSIAVDSAENAYVVGNATSPDFPVTPGAYQTVMKTPGHGTPFVARFDLSSPPQTSPTITTLTSSANPQFIGQPIEFSASVMGADSSTITAGDVTFYVDGTYAAAEPLNGAGTASYSTTTLSGGPHTILAIYGGSSAYALSVAPLTETITTTAIPTISPAAGRYIGPTQVKLSDATPNAQIHYTLDGSTPTSASPVYTGALVLSAYTVVSAIATSGSLPPSAALQAAYTIVPQTPAPMFGPAPGVYPGGVPLMVTLTDANAAATIRYTANGSTPSAQSTWYNGPIPVISSETINAIAIAADEDGSPVASGVYTFVTATPSISPAPGHYIGTVGVTMGDITPGATIHYTLNGSTPGIGSPVYGGQINLSAGYTTVRAIATSTAYPSSAIAEAAYSVQAQNPTPVLTPGTGTYAPGQTVTITDSDTAATIRYTTDNSTPTTRSPVYSWPLPLSGTETIQAIATGTADATSNVAVGIYTPQ